VVTSAVQGCPQVTQEITLYANLKRIDLATRLLKDSTPLQEIYIAFPFGMADPKFKYESALSVMEPGVDQFPGSNTDYYAVQHWASVCDGEAGVTLTALDAAMMEFGGLWPGYVSQAHHAVKTPDFGHEFLKPGDLKKGYIYSYVLCSNFRTNFRPVQTGETLFRYSITSERGGWRGGRARDFGWAASLPLVPVYLWGCGGEDLPHTDSFCRIDAANVVLLALKHAEDGDGLILRLWEVEGEDTEVVVHLPFVEVVQAWETNLVEEGRRPLPVKDGSIAVPLKAWSISTVRILTA
jgi:alpha-mannosidase